MCCRAVLFQLDSGQCQILTRSFGRWLYLSHLSSSNLCQPSIPPDETDTLFGCMPSSCITAWEVVSCFLCGLLPSAGRIQLQLVRTLARSMAPPGAPCSGVVAVCQECRVVLSRGKTVILGPRYSACWGAPDWRSSEKRCSVLAAFIASLVCRKSCMFHDGG